MTRCLTLLVSFISLVLAACSSPAEGDGRPLGQACEADEDCEDGLACLDGGELADDNGAPVCRAARFCSQACATDDDCAEVAEGTICIDACDIVDPDARAGIGGPVCFEGSRG